jgi:hypothetical protein
MYLTIEQKPMLLRISKTPVASHSTFIIGIDTKNVISYGLKKGRHP